MAELETFGPCTRQVHAHPTVPGRTVTSYYLTEPQALLVCALSRTEAGRKLRAELIQVFMAWRRGELNAPKPSLPDFTNPALAARAFADEYEQKLIAQAKAVVLEAEVVALSEVIGYDGLRHWPVH